MIGAMSAVGLDEATKRLVLVACILGTTVVTVDSTAINVALPAIAEDLGGGLAGPAVDGQRLPASRSARCC